MFFSPSKSRLRAKIRIMGVSKTSDHIQIKIKMPNPSQEPPASSEAPNEDLKDIDVLCTFKITIVSQNLDHRYIKDQWPYQNQDENAKLKSGTYYILRSPKWGLKGHWSPLRLENKDIEPKLGTGCIKSQWPYSNQDQDAKAQSGSSGILQSP